MIHHRTVEIHLKTKGCMKIYFMQPFVMVNHGVFHILATARKTVCRVVTMTIKAVLAVFDCNRGAE